jgi:hypothetical protein
MKVIDPIRPLNPTCAHEADLAVLVIGMDMTTDGIGVGERTARQCRRIQWPRWKFSIIWILTAISPKSTFDGFPEMEANMKTAHHPPGTGSRRVRLLEGRAPVEAKPAGNGRP